MQRFLDDIEALVNETVDMGNLASEMIEKSVQAIVDGNVELADGLNEIHVTTGNSKAPLTDRFTCEVVM